MIQSSFIPRIVEGFWNIVQEAIFVLSWVKERIFTKSGEAWSWTRSAALGFCNRTTEKVSTVAGNIFFRRKSGSQPAAQVPADSLPASPQAPARQDPQQQPEAPLPLSLASDASLLPDAPSTAAVVEIPPQEEQSAPAQAPSSDALPLSDGPDEEAPSAAVFVEAPPQEEQSAPAASDSILAPASPSAAWPIQDAPQEEPVISSSSSSSSSSAAFPLPPMNPMPQSWALPASSASSSSSASSTPRPAFFPLQPIQQAALRVVPFESASHLGSPEKPFLTLKRARFVTSPIVYPAISPGLTDSFEIVSQGDPYADFSRSQLLADHYNGTLIPKTPVYSFSLWPSLQKKVGAVLGDNLDPFASLLNFFPADKAFRVGNERGVDALKEEINRQFIKDFRRHEHNPALPLDEQPRLLFFNRKLMSQAEILEKASRNGVPEEALADYCMGEIFGEEFVKAHQDKMNFLKVFLSQSAGNVLQDIAAKMLDISSIRAGQMVTCSEVIEKDGALHCWTRIFSTSQTFPVGVDIPDDPASIPEVPIEVAMHLFLKDAPSFFHFSCQKYPNLNGVSTLVRHRFLYPFVIA